MKHPRWVKKSPMHTARSHFAVAVHRGKVYVFGGGGADFRSLNSTEIYDPQLDIWAKGKDMPTTRSGAVAAVLNEKIFVMGGGIKLPDGRFEFFKNVEIYDPEADSWGKGAEMLMPHDYPTSVVYGGRIYVIGGHHPEATKGGPMTDPGFSFCEVFSPPDNLWREAAPMPTARFALASAIFHNRILVMGGAGLREDGFRNFDVIESYDPCTNQWSEAGFRLPWPAAGLGACVINDRLYILGGNSGKQIENRFACYNPDTDKWTEIEEMDKGRIAIGVVTIEDTIYIIGGRGSDGKIPINSVETYQIRGGSCKSLCHPRNLLSGI